MTPCMPQALYGTACILFTLCRSANSIALPDTSRQSFARSDANIASCELSKENVFMILPSIVVLFCLLI